MTSRLPLVALSILALAACSPGDAAKAPAALAAAPPPAQAAPPPEPPPTWSRADSQVELSLHIDTAVEAHPRLYAQLFEDGRAKLEAFGDESRELRAQHPVSRAAAPYSMSIDYGDPVETGRLLSLQGGDWFYSGGAHGNGSVSAILWDKTAGRRLEPRRLFRAGADLSALDQAVCRGIRAAKAARVQKNGWEPGETFACFEDAAKDPFALAPGDVPGKAGGLIFLYAPYALGAYAEGGYGIVVPLEAFAALLAPEWADQFASAPTAETLRLYRAG